MKRKLIAEKDYLDLFLINTNDKKVDIKKTFEQALETRKFEIEHYWKRAIYFWTFIGLCFVGFFALDRNKLGDYEFESMRFMLSAVGFIFSLAWYYANKGSKYWQENWERHISLLQDYEIGPLYRILLDDSILRKKGFFVFFRNIIAPRRYSVTNINQLLSLFMVIVWLTMFVKSIFIVFLIPTEELLNTFGWAYENLFHISIVLITVFFAMFLWGSKHNSKKVTNKHLISFEEKDVGGNIQPNKKNTPL